MRQQGERGGVLGTHSLGEVTVEAQDTFLDVSFLLSRIPANVKLEDAQALMTR